MACPDFNQALSELWGAGWSDEVAAFMTSASNVVVGDNPPWGAADFFTMYPKFGGTTTGLVGAISQGGTTVTGIGTTDPNNPTDTSGLFVGMPVAGAGISPGCAVASVDSVSQITLTLPCTSTVASAALTVFNQPFLVPLPVLNAYVALAQASLIQARWQGTWSFAMALFVAHFVTLWLQSELNFCGNPGQIAAAGLQRGITTAKSIGQVSQTIQPVTGLDEWAAWTLTTYGVQLATFFKGIGAGPMFLW
jgi:hypothetical protein